MFLEIEIFACDSLDWLGKDSIFQECRGGGGGVWASLLKLLPLQPGLGRRKQMDILILQ